MDLFAAVLSKRVHRSFEPLAAVVETRAARMAREYLNSHIQHDIALDELAQICGVDEHWLIKAFKATHGVPPHACLIDLQVRHAVELLRKGEAIADVATICGFADQSHLTRCFKRAIGATPGAFRMR